MCIRYGEDATEPSTPPPLTKKRRVRPTMARVLRDWYTRTYMQIARNKVGSGGDDRGRYAVDVGEAVWEQGAVCASGFGNT
jgi:hypothetical protein